MFILLDHPTGSSWDSDLTRQADPHILQTLSWADFKQTRHWQPLFVYDPVHQLPVLVLKRQLAPLAGSVLYVPRGPALSWNRPESASILTDLLQFLTRELAPAHHALLVKVESEARADDQSAAAAFSTSGFVASSLHPQFKKTMWIDLKRSEEEILTSFHQKTRYNIRLAEKKGVVITDVHDQASLRLFYDLHLSTGARGHFPVRSFSYYEQLWTSLLDAGRAKLFMAWHEGELLGGVLLFAFHARAYYQYGASGQKKRALMPNHLLQWYSIKWAKQAGFATYDLVGLPETPDPKDPFYGVWKFKQGFQGEIKEFIGAMDYYPSPGKKKAWNLLYPIVRRGLWHIKHDVFF